MPEDDIAQLSEDIAKHGQREPGVMFEGKVLDGWHRYRACYLAGVEFRSVEFGGEDPVAFVLSQNLHRRHLTAMQRAAAVVAATNWRKRGSATVADPSVKSLAEKADVSARTIEHAKAAQEIGLGAEAREGRVTARQVEQVANLPKGKRDAAVKKIKEGGELPAPKKAKASSKDVERLRAELLDVQGKYADLAEKNTDLADTARELQDKLEMYEAKEPDEQQKLIASLQKKVLRLEGEVDRVTRDRNDQRTKANQLIAEVKRLKKKAGEK